MPSDQNPDSRARDCPKCGGALKWFRSEADKALGAIHHVFSCTACGAINCVAGPIGKAGPDLGAV